MTRRDSIKSMFGAFLSWGALPDSVSVAELCPTTTSSNPFREAFDAALAKLSSEANAAWMNRMHAEYNRLSQ